MQYWSLVHDADLFVDLSNLFREGQWNIGGTGGKFPPLPLFCQVIFIRTFCSCENLQPLN